MFTFVIEIKKGKILI